MKDRFDLRLGDCLEVVRTLDAMSVDAIVTDPPAGISFMGKEWDHHKGGRDKWIAWMAEIAAECLRVAKPGAHALVWALPRTSHWTATAWEDAGWEVRDRVAHLFGSGFPKSLDVSKAIDRRPGATSHMEFASHLATRRAAMGMSRADVSEAVVGTRSGACWNWEHHQFPEAKWWPALRAFLNLDSRWGAVIAEAERERVGVGTSGTTAIWAEGGMGNFDITTPATDAARQWEGWGTALKPAMEDWWLLRKPLTGTVAQNVQQWGTGALNIDGARVAHGDPDIIRRTFDSAHGIFTPGPRQGERGAGPAPFGRWPAHLTLSCWCDSERHDPECAVAMLDAQSGETGGSYRAPSARVRNNGIGLGDNTERAGMSSAPDQYGGTGGASRFFYVAKSSRSEREAGVAVEAARRTDGREKDIENPRLRTTTRLNDHPTVKPIELMRWLCRLITPPDGLVLDLFMGSGTTGMAALDEGFRFLGVEAEARYYEIAEDRITHRHLVEMETVEPKAEEPQGRLL